jgi:uncharacterized protein with HEPN domain
MLPERDLGSLEDIRQYAADALSFVTSMSFDEFVASKVTTNAVLRCLIVIGEAAGRLSPAVYEELSQFDWRGMTGMRHIVVHHYDRVNYSKVWEVIEVELPKLRDELGAYLAAIE